jgi:hypothetical protein
VSKLRKSAQTPGSSDFEEFGEDSQTTRNLSKLPRGYFNNIPRLAREGLKITKNLGQVNDKVPNLFLLHEYFLVEWK